MLDRLIMLIDALCGYTVITAYWVSDEDWFVEIPTEDIPWFDHHERGHNRTMWFNRAPTAEV